VAIISKFAAEHPNELFSSFAYTVDSLYTGVALNFDTLENSLKEAQREEQYQVKHRNRLFATERGWEDARYQVAHHINRIDDCNLRGPFQYDLVAFVELPVWADYFENCEDCSELEGRVIVSLWQVVDRLVDSGVFEKLRLSSYFRVAFCFHDDEMIVLRILNWPRAERDAEAGGTTSKPPV
jgi:hypothetical protein